MEKEQQQSSEQKTQAAISIGASVLGALFGRKTLSASNVGRVTTAARGMGRIARESQDIARAQQNVTAIQDQLNELEASVQAEIAATRRDVSPADRAARYDLAEAETRRVSRSSSSR